MLCGHAPSSPLAARRPGAHARPTGLDEELTCQRVPLLEVQALGATQGLVCARQGGGADCVRCARQATWARWCAPRTRARRPTRARTSRSSSRAPARPSAWRCAARAPELAAWGVGGRSPGRAGARAFWAGARRRGGSACAHRPLRVTATFLYAPQRQPLRRPVPIAMRLISGRGAHRDALKREVCWGFPCGWRRASPVSRSLTSPGDGAQRFGRVQAEVRTGSRGLAICAFGI